MYHHPHFLYRKKPVVVVGGGDVAMEEALFLTRYASEVTVVHRFDYLEASKVMARRVKAAPNINFLWSTEVLEAKGDEEGCLSECVYGGGEGVGYCGLGLGCGRHWHMAKL
jgi:thioredoxin reductase